MSGVSSLPNNPNVAGYDFIGDLNQEEEFVTSGTLHPLVTYDPVAEQASSKRWEIVWKITEIAQIILFPLLLARYAIAFCKHGVNFINHDTVWANSNFYAQKAEFDALLIAQIGKTGELAKCFLDLKDSIFSLKKISPLLAMYSLYKEKIAQASSIEAKAAFNLNAAYLLKIMQSPYENRPLESFCTHRFIDLAFTESDKLTTLDGNGSFEDDICVKTEEKNYTFKDISKMDTAQLAHKIFEVREKGPGRIWL